MLNNLIKELNKKASPKRKKANEWFFKTGEGQYGYGDKFVGISMPDIRAIAKKYFDLSMDDVLELVKSEIHEYRMTGLVILVYQFEKANEKLRKKIYKTYLKNTKYINNWDLVDVTTPRIVGGYLLDKKKERKVLYKLVKSKSLWERRIAVLATFMFISKNDFKDSVKIGEKLLKDKHDLIHKAVGWMLREIGKRDEVTLLAFLDRHYKVMPRTMLQYSIERLSPEQREFYMKK
jgi:3-methyladenine DNA glycosylase AlkD